MEYREAGPSVGQRLLWFLDRYRGDNGSLNCPLLCRIRGPLDTAALQQAVDVVVARHESLRSVFLGGGRRLVRRIMDELPAPVTQVELSSAADPEAALRAAVALELRTRVDAAENPLRLTLWRVGPGDHVLCFNMHHLVTDSWSLGVIFEDLCAALERATGKDVDLPAEGWPYSSFALEQDRQLSGEPKRRLDTYWRRRLEGLRLPALPLAPEPPGRTGRATALARGLLPEEVVSRLRALARTERTTLFTILLTSYYAMLYRSTGDPDLSVATLFANRSRPEVQRTVGFLANMVVLRAELRPGQPFTAALRVVHESVIGGFLHQALPFQMLPMPTAAAGQRADDVVFQMLAEPVYTTTSAGLQLEVMVPEGVGSRFEFELVLVPEEAGSRVLLFFDADRLAADFAEDFVAGYVAAVTAVAADPATPIDRLSATTPMTDPKETP